LLKLSLAGLTASVKGFEESHRRKSAGIEAIVLKDDAGGMFPSLQGTEGFACWFHKTRKRMPGEYLRKRKCGDEMKRIAVLTSGSDTPGMNAAIA
jgi:hypothetical protein